MSDSPKTLLERLGATPEHTYPRELLTEIKARLPEMVPALLGVLEDVRHAPGDFADESSSWMLPVFAAYFLAEARETRAWKPLIGLLGLPDGAPDILFGDMITEDMDRVMASVFDGNEQPLRDLVENPEADEFIRTAGLGCYVHLFQNDLLPRETVPAYFTGLMRGGLRDSNHVVWSNLAIYCGIMGLAHLIPDIRAAYADGRCDPMVDREENVVDQAGNGGDPAWLAKATLIGDSIELTEGWYCFHPIPAVRPSASRGNIKVPQFPATPLSTTPRSSPKIGRNDPCPCGSGKKYKKCCGA